MLSYSTIDTCRICGSDELHFLFSLGDQYVNNFVPESEIHSGNKVPINIILCRRCGLVQQRHTADQEFLYTRQYWYKSGVTEMMRNALADITKTVENLIPLEFHDVVLDIGSNDGTLLRSYTKPLVTVGVEPALNLADEGKQGVNYFINDFWDAEKYMERVGKKAKVITAIGMFYDLEDPNTFIGDIEKCLDDNGVFISQLMCLKNMMNTMDIGNLCHEHLEFYSLRSLMYLFDKNGLEIFDIATNKVNNESYRIFARKKGSQVQLVPNGLARVKECLSHEQYLNDVYVLKDFFKTMEKNKDETIKYLKELKEKGFKTWLYGASTKGNTILQYYGIDTSLVEAAAERSPSKWGLYTIGTGIPIVSEEEARCVDPSHFFVLPYTFLEEFKKREVVWRSNGGRFIVPLPHLRVV